MKCKAIKALTISLATVAILGQADYQRGVSYYKQGQYSKAIIEFEELIQSEPDYETGYRILGDSYLKIKNYEKAVHAFQEALRLKKDSFFSYYGLSLAYFNTNRHKDTIATLVKGEHLAISPRDRYTLHHIRGAAYFNTNQFREAVSDLKKAAAIQRGNFENLLQLGIATYRLDRFSEAEQYLKQALALDPKSDKAKDYFSRLRYQKAIEAIEKANYQEAITLLMEHTQINPESGESWFNLGLAQLFSGHLLASELAFQKSAALLSENWEVYDRLGYIYEKKENYGQALKNYQKAQQKHSNPQIVKSIQRIQERIQRKKTP